MSNLYIAGYNAIGEAGFPNVLCPVIFLPRCNFKCPYCLNYKLVENKGCLTKINLSHTINRFKRDGESRILISGGEPCLNNKLFEIIDELIKNNFEVRISTNGSFPKILQKLIDKKLISFVAMDIKTGFDDLSKWNMVCDIKNIHNEVLKSIKILSNSNIDFELRTTLFPEIVKEDDILSISNHIPENSIWILQQFRVRSTLLGGKSVTKVKPYQQEKIKKMVNIAKKRIKNVYVRYV